MPLHPSRHRAGDPSLYRALLCLDMKRIYQRDRYKVVILTLDGRIKTKEYQACSTGDAWNKADACMDVDRVLAVEKIEEPKAL